MDAFKIFILAILSILKISHAQHVTTCDTTTVFDAAGQISYVNWPEDENSYTFCPYVFKAPVNHYLRAKISYNLAGISPSCSGNQYVAVSIDNMANWDGYTRMCGFVSQNDSVVVKSIGNELKLGISSSDYYQYVSISVEVMPLEQGKCDCSWSPRTRVANGKEILFY
jgi:hypothetical protein